MQIPPRNIQMYRGTWGHTNVWRGAQTYGGIQMYGSVQTYGGHIDTPKSITSVKACFLCVVHSTGASN